MLYRRSIFLINKKFQLRFSFYVCSWLIALSFVYPLIIFNLFNYLMRYLALDPLGPTIANLEKTREDLLWLLAIMELIFLSLTFLISIFMSHKIAGPLYKLKKTFQEAKAGKLNLKLSFRKRDYFQDLVQPYNEMMESIQQKIAGNSHQVELAISHILKAQSTSSLEARLELDAALNALKESQKNT
jgi:sensor histidine kinase YesM